MGNLLNVSSSAFCKPSGKLTPVCMASKNSVLLSFLRFATVVSAAFVSSPKLCNFFNKAGVALPATSRPTLAGISFCEICLSSALSFTYITCAANRRGDANAVTLALSSVKPCAVKLSNKPLAKDSPNL